MLVNELSLNASKPIFVTGLPSMFAGITNSPVAEVSQPVMVTESPITVYWRKLGT